MAATTAPLRITKVMTFALNDVVPWGRSFDEYAAMFALDRHDLSRREPSPYVNPLIECLARDGWAARLELVGYEFQRGGNLMLRCTPSVHLRVATWPASSG